jgi:hypothetical protein
MEKDHPLIEKTVLLKNSGGAEGVVKKYLELLWGSRFIVEITKPGPFHSIVEIEDFFPHQIEEI